MIGHSNAGKTTYVSSMYAVGRAGVRGFRIQAKDPGHDTELLRHAAAIRRGSYPPPSAHRTTYDFQLSYRRRTFFEFTWSDYRGGALLDRSTEAETAAVLTDLRLADGIVVFADAHAVLTDQRAPRQLRRLTTLLQRSLETGPRDTPLVIAYTKADLVSAAPAQWDRIREPLAPITAALNSSGHVLATEVGVACGRSPMNVEVPLLWCLGNALVARVARLEEDLATSRRNAKEYNRRSSLGDDLSSWWNGTTSYTKMATQAREDAKRELAALRPLRRPARQLASTLVRSHPAGAATVRAVQAGTR